MSDAWNDFELASGERDLPFVAEFVLFLKENKKWWLLPILILIGIVVLFAVLAQTGAGPFVYPMF